MKLLDCLLRSIRNASVFNPEVQVAPACVLWPDRDRQWENVIPLLQSNLPELLVLGEYLPGDRKGPAIWIRCVLAGLDKDVAISQENIPIVYLPGVSRQDLRAVENCPDTLKPLAELQYRGVIWSQMNSKDWTIFAYLKSDQGGLGLDVAQDSDAKYAMGLSLHKLLDEEISLLSGKRLDKDYFNTLLTGGDPIRELLQWLDQGESFRLGCGENEWKAFVEVTKSKLSFNPQDEGVLAGNALLASHQGPWDMVWNRYREAPGRYGNIPTWIRKCHPPSDTILWHTDDEAFDGWPQWNEAQEEALRSDLMALSMKPDHEAKKSLQELERRHGRRRLLVWAELGEAPLAFAIEHLAVIAEITMANLTNGSLEDIVKIYTERGWRADDGAIRALACVDKSNDLDAVITAIRSVYLPWMENSARYLQKLVDESSYPGGSIMTVKTVSFVPGDCVLFVDGLRFDVAKRLVESLRSCGAHISEEPVWAALPSVTATGKPAVAPVRDKISGEEDSSDFEPSVSQTGQSLRGGYHLKKLLIDNGWSTLDQSTYGDFQGMAWCEFGDIDHEGHERGWKLAKYIDTLIEEIKDRIMELLVAGWNRVFVVTDHGWLLLPGGLPKIDLPSALSDNKWGRCASLKPGASSDERLYPWFWNRNIYFALADGVSCFKKGEEYAHGGVSFQECLNLQLSISLGKIAKSVVSAKFTDLVWKGLRCTVAVDGEFSGLSLDVRAQAGCPSSSLVVSVKPLKDNGTASVVVEDEDMEGREAMAVLIDFQGNLIAQIATVIGGDDS